MPADFDDIRRLIARGHYLAAYDRTCIESSPTEIHERVQFGHLRALALARSGAAGRAAEELALALLLANSADLEPVLAEDLAALKARLAKDHALRVDLPDRSAAAAEAAAEYEAVFSLHGRPYACVNAATLWLVAGHRDRAENLARETLRLVEAAENDLAENGEQFWSLVTKAEAALILGESMLASDALEAAAHVNPEALGARATTRRQLRLLCETLSLDPALVIEALRQPEVMHYSGHMTMPAGQPARFPAECESEVAMAVAQRIDARHVGFAYGSLACGADIVIAEALLERGVELHVVLPFAIEEFIMVSVAVGGVTWEPRFRACLDAAASVIIVSDSAHRGDDELFAYAARFAMGEARNKANGIEAEAFQLLVWDGVDDAQTAGTAADRRAWLRSGGTCEVVAVTATARRSATRKTPSRRHIRSVLFGDFSGFSRLRDEHFDDFVHAVMSPVAQVLESFGDDVLVRNTWGDGLFVVVSDAVAGAKCALAIQRAFAAVDLGGAGLPVDMGLRLAGHTAPVVEVFDPILGRPHIMGRELTRAARIEPRTPVGQVYVTAGFAALLALEPASGIVPEYVGVLTTAKDFETTPMYLLRSTV